MDSNAQTPANLEAQLRTRGNHQQRGRGRGGFPRALWRDPSNQHTQGQNANTPAATSASPGFRRGRVDAPQRGNRSQQAQSNTQIQPPPHSRSQDSAADGAQTQSSPPLNRQAYAPRPSRQARQQGQAGQAAIGDTPTPKILQRPQHNNLGPRNIAPGSPSPQHSPRMYHQHMSQAVSENPLPQIEYLDRLAAEQVPKAEISGTELEEKEAFRQYLEGICKTALTENYSGDIATIALVGFGSLASGFATPGSDMDLAIVPAWKDASRTDTEIDHVIPRLLEKAILDDKLGARLLTRTRVPILKVCQHPTEDLYTALSDERKKWDGHPEEDLAPEITPLIKADDAKSLASIAKSGALGPMIAKSLKITLEASNEAKSKGPKSGGSKQEGSPTPTATPQDTATSKDNVQAHRHHIYNKIKSNNTFNDRKWLREKVLGPLDFPKAGVGIQCDINFENPLGIHNTHLLRCYALCDPRVRPIVLFVKAWVKRRKINSSYSGTLSSYGWVLMVLHYLVNVAQPPVCPNLQLYHSPPADVRSLEQMFKDKVVHGYSVRFWRNETEITQAARLGQLSRNTQSIGALLRGFFQYFASQSHGYGHGPRPPSFYWTSEVLSLRTKGGLRTKQDKEWTGAKTTISNGKEVRQRYLFAIEDPFELDHNVARTVTHNGIVAIRDEFRRAWRILTAVSRSTQPEGGIFDEVIEEPPAPLTPKKEEEGKGNGVVAEVSSSAPVSSGI